MAWAIAVVLAAACQRRSEPVLVVALASGARFDAPRRAREVPPEAANEHQFALADGSLLIVAEEALRQSCDAHIAWAIDQARQGGARGVDRVTVGGRAGVQARFATEGPAQQVDMIGVCAGSTFVIFQVAQRGTQLEPALERLVQTTAASLRDPIGDQPIP